MTLRSEPLPIFPDLLEPGRHRHGQAFSLKDISHYSHDGLIETLWEVVVTLKSDGEVSTFTHPVVVGPTASSDIILPAHQLMTGKVDGDDPLSAIVMGGMISAIGLLAANLATTPNWTMIGVAIIGFGLATGLYLGRNALTQVMLGRAYFGLSAEVFQGSELEMTLNFTPRGSVQINGIYCEVVCKDSIGREEFVARKIVSSTKVVMSEERHLPAGQKAEFYSRYRIPDFAAVSRIQGNYETRWTVRVHLDVELGPDWKREKEFLVLPSRGRIASDEEE